MFWKRRTQQWQHPVEVTVKPPKKHFEIGDRVIVKRNGVHLEREVFAVSRMGDHVKVEKLPPVSQSQMVYSLSTGSYTTQTQISGESLPDSPEQTWIDITEVEDYAN